MNKPSERPEFKVIDNKQISENSIDINQIANIVATKANTIIMNTTIKEMNQKIDVLNNGIAELVNEFKKQSVDEKNSSFKMARRNKPGAIPMKSIDSHITHIISLVHIAEIFKLRTQKGDKYSSQKARQLLIDLNLINNPNFVSKTLSGAVNILKKYHFDILYEICSRLQNASNYNIEPGKCLHWREICFIPDENEIQTYIDNLSILLDVTEE